MNQLLQQASRALSMHDADTLERLAAQASSCSTSGSAAEIARSLEVLRQQVTVAAGHLELQRRLQEPWHATEQRWVR